MPLQKQTIPVLLSSLAQKAPQQTGITGTLDVCQNMVALKGDQTTGFQGRAGGLEFWPRPGVSAVSKTADSGTITAGVRMATLGPSLLLQTGNALYRRAIDEWHQVSATMPIVGVKSTPIVSSSAAIGSCDSVYVNGYTVSVYTTNPNFPNGSVGVLVTDSNGVTVVNTVLATGQVGSVRIVVSGTAAIVIFTSLTLLMKAWKFDSTAPGVIASVITVASTVFGRIDLQTVGASGTVVISWLDTGTSTYKLALLTVSTMSVGTPVNTTIAGFSCFSFLTNDWSTNVIYVGYGGSGSGITLATFNGSTLAPVTTTVYDAATTYVLNIAGNRTGGTATIYATTSPDGTTAYPTGTFTNAFDFRIVVTSGSAVTTVLRGLSLASRVLSANGTLYALAKYSGPNQGSYFLLDLVEMVSVGRAAQDLGYTGQLTGPEVLPNLSLGATANNWQTSALKVIADAAGGAAYIGAVAIAFTFLDVTVGRGVELDGGVHFPGSQPYLYDGQYIVEEGFPIGPEVSDAIIQSTGGGSELTLLATYTIRFVFAWIDAAGNLHRSNPSTPQSFTLAGTNNQAALSIPTLRNTLKQGVVIEIYSTLANGDDSTYFQILPFGVPLYNNPAVDRVSFTMTLPDTTIVGGEPLYTDGNVLENIASAPCKAFVAHKGRLLASGIDGDPQAVWFSKDVEPGFGVAFNDGLVSRLQSVSDPITSIISMDAFAVACTAGGTTWASSDQYPDDTGVGGVLTFQQYSSMVGCTNAGLMARTDDGVTMWGGAVVTAANVPPKNIWQCSRGLVFQYLGAAVEQDAIGFSPVAVFAVPLQNQIRIVGTDANGISCALVYESIFGSWSTWRYTAQATALVDAIMWNGSAAYLCADGTVLLESATLIDDLGVPASVPHIITLSTLNFAQVGAYQRIYGANCTGRVLGAGGFTAQVDQSFDGTAIPRKTLPIGAGTTALNLDFDPANAGKCSSSIVTISDASNAANSAWTLAAMTYDVGIKPPRNRLPPVRRAA
jgi:hypothetical protein